MALERAIWPGDFYTLSFSWNRTVYYVCKYILVGGCVAGFLATAF